jgi:pre-rRNA-processing protein RIX1
MAPIASELSTLRALTFRISSTATSQLPFHVPAIAASLANCRTLLSSTQTSGTKSSTSSEASVAVHKYRTLLSTLLQDRAIQGRWSAIVLIKATIEVGGWETLQKCLPWVRGLLGVLTKPDPPSSKKLCIITLTRIFVLTREYPTLVREVTTPSLPAFIQSGLQLANSKSSAGLLHVILESFYELLPRHPTLFRSYLKQLQPLLARLVAPTPSSKLGHEQGEGQQFSTMSVVVDAAQQLYVQVPCCAPKGTSSEEWEKSLKGVVNSTHQVADKVFRAVVEDWRPSTRSVPSVNGHTLDDEVQELEPTGMALPPWSGIFAGSERLVRLLQLVQQHLDNPTANPVRLDVVAIMDLLTRMLSITVPATGEKSSQNSSRLNSQVTKEERDSLWLVLPSVHVAAMEALLALANRTQSSTLALDSQVLDQIVWVFSAEKDIVQLRTACYTTTAILLQRSGTSLPKSSIDSLVPLMRACCEDILPSELDIAVGKETPGQAKANGKAQPQITGNADTYLNSSKGLSSDIVGFAGLTTVAHGLLPLLFTNIRVQYLSDSMRARLDRTAILVQHKDAMVASVLNPPPSKKFGKPAASILPLMARSFPADKSIEGMLRPRMPAIRLGGQDVEIEDAEEDEEEDEDNAEADEEYEELVHEDDDDHFVGQELDTLLESAGRAETTTEAPISKDIATSDSVAPQTHKEYSRSASTHITSRDNTTSAVGESIQSADSGKRPYIEETPLSPSKRVRFGEVEQRRTQPFAPAATTPAADTATVPAPSDFTVTTTASAVPELPVPGEAQAEGDTDSDEGDIIPLVLGQDTDEESE